ncbi:MAG: ABC transporter ATP-binding protein [Candidatus Brocadiia bacterium]
MPENLIAIKDLSKSYGDIQALKGMSLELRRGEVLGLLGPNGAGKTTLLKAALGLVPYESGSIEYFGVPHRPPPPAIRRRIGYVPQEIALYQELTAAGNLSFFGSLYGLAGVELKQAVDSALQTVQLTDSADRKVDGFSGGMKRRLNIAAALLSNPEVLLCDEPTVGVDPQSRTFILHSLAGFASKGVAVLYCTHYMEEAESLCDRVAILDHGKLLVCGTKAEIHTTVKGLDIISIALEGKWNIGALELGKLTFVSRVISSDVGLQLYVEDGEKRIAPILDHLARHNAGIAAVSLVRRNLETVFMELTGRELRDGE